MKVRRQPPMNADQRTIFFGHNSTHYLPALIGREVLRDGRRVCATCLGREPRHYFVCLNCDRTNRPDPRRDYSPAKAPKSKTARFRPRGRKAG